MEKIKILVVDDEVRVRDEIAEFLTENKYVCVSSRQATSNKEYINMKLIKCFTADEACRS